MRPIIGNAAVMFQSHPRLQFYNRTRWGRTWWQLMDDLSWSLSVGRENTFIVPAGFMTDGASTPRILWWLLEPFGRYYRSAVLHDYLYSKQATCSRFLADAIFRDSMYEEGVIIIVRVPMYYAVRLLGWTAWKKR